MLVKQISVFLENKEGRVAQVARILSDANINIRALSIADTTEFGILRLIVDHPRKAEEALRNEGFTVSITEVIAISIEDAPGGLADALQILHEDKISVEYIYAFISKTSHKANVILRVEDCERAIKSLQAKGLEVLSSDAVYNQ
ncbi:MAG TPA: ACT domain-containing protein [Clostridia bacterium]|nr:ACT domain-containing protein [Clostridia bacterium]HRX42133.1 ACT domain-containing protein [Clostridia bacterium]